jgi:hypothetical protein
MAVAKAPTEYLCMKDDAGNTIRVGRDDQDATKLVVSCRDVRKDPPQEVPLMLTVLQATRLRDALDKYIGAKKGPTTRTKLRRNA